MTARILIVEDESIIAMDMKNTLAGLNYEVIGIAVSGEEAIRQAAELRPDLLIMDISLGGEIDGIDAVNEIRKSQDIPAVYLTSHSNRVTFERAIQTQPHGYLVKPVGRNDLYSSIETALNRHRLEKKLRESEERFRCIVENSHEGILILDDSHRFLYLNDELCRILGYPYEQIIGHDFRKFVDEESGELVADRYARRQKGMPVPEQYEFSVLRKSGEKRRIEIISTIIKNTDGEVQTISRLLDITDLKRHEQALRESERKYRSIIENIEEGYFEVDLKGDLVFVNESLCKMAGVPKDRLIGLNNRDYTSPQTARKMYRIFTEIYKTGRPANVSDYEVARPDGTMLVLELSSSLIRGGQGEPVGFRGIIRDTTARRQVQDEKERMRIQLLQAQKMESIGTLAGGIAHDFNNLLTSILGSVELAMGEIGGQQPHLKDCLNQIRDSSLRAADLTAQLLTFSRKKKMNFMPVDINSLISNLLKMITRLINENISVKCDLSPGLHAARADASSLEQVILNLVINARDAMPEGGTLEIATGNMRCDDVTQVLNHRLRNGDFIRITVSDTGTGMDQETIGKIFDPFFTTKPIGKGTGLGMSISFGIIDQHGGWIDVQSVPGKGSSFCVYIPAHPHSEEITIEPHGATENFRGNGERLLVVEDQAEVLSVTRRALEMNGYVIRTASSCEEAIEIFHREQGNFSLIMTDIMLPDRSGFALAETLLSERPDLKLLFSSGYSGYETALSESGSGRYHYLPKPYSLFDLLKKIREAMTARVVA